MTLRATLILDLEVLGGPEIPRLHPDSSVAPPLDPPSLFTAPVLPPLSRQETPQGVLVDTLEALATAVTDIGEEISSPSLAH